MSILITNRAGGGGGGVVVKSFTIANNQVAPADVTGFSVDPLLANGFISEMSIVRRTDTVVTGSVNAPYVANLPSLNGAVVGSASSGSGTVIVGDFSQVNAVARARITKLNANGTEDAVFAANVGIGFNSAAIAVASYSDGSVLVGGAFSHLNGVLINPGRIVKLSSAGVLDAPFNTNLGGGPNGAVQTLAIQTDGKALIGGDFTSWNANPINRLVRINADGTEDTAFTTNLGTGFNGRVRSVVVNSSGSILVAGQFTSFNGNARDYFVQLNADGTENATFYSTAIASGGFTGGTLYEAFYQADGKVLLGGDFTGFAGVTNYGVVRLSATGVPDTAFNSNTVAGFAAQYSILAIGQSPQGKIVVGGDFTVYDGNSNLVGVAQLNLDGTTDATFTANFVAPSPTYLGASFNYNANGLYIGSYDGTGAAFFSRLGEGLVELSTQQTLRGVYNSLSGVWSVGAIVSIGDAVGVSFSMTPAGQLQYTSTNIAGTVLASIMRFVVQAL